MNTPTPTVAGSNTHCVSFARKVNLGNYESKDATIFVQFDLPVGTDLTEVVQQAASAFAAAQISVFDTLGLSYQVDFDGSVTETDGSNPAPAAAPVAPPVAAVAAAPAAPETAVMAAFPGAQVVARDDSKPPFDSYTKVKSERAANTAWAVGKYTANPNDFYDNRADKEPGSSRPDFKHKDSGVAIWLDKNGNLPS